MLDRIADGRTDLVFDYVAAGNPATAIVNRLPLIRHCAYYGDVTAMKFLLAQGESLAALGENLGLSGACFHGHWRLLRYLIEQGADVNRASVDTGETPLLAVLCKTNRIRYTPLVRILLAAGADPNCATLPGEETGSFMRDCRTKGKRRCIARLRLGTKKTSACCLTPARVSTRRMRTGIRLSAGRVGTFAPARFSICFATGISTLIQSGKNIRLASRRTDRWRAP